jgi:hypothetical protein
MHIQQTVVVVQIVCVVFFSPILLTIAFSLPTLPPVVRAAIQELRQQHRPQLQQEFDTMQNLRRQARQEEAETEVNGEAEVMTQLRARNEKAAEAMEKAAEAAEAMAGTKKEAAAEARAGIDGGGGEW